MSYGSDIPAPGNTSRFSADEIILYGIKLNYNDDFATLDLTQRLDFTVPDIITVLRMELWGKRKGNPFKRLEKDTVTIAAVYGYAFEGHCFRPDKARIYAFHYDGPDTLAVGCGFGEPGSATPTPYFMWRVKSKTPLMEMSTTLDTAEMLILEANMPGKRAPNTYESRMELGHRGGRLKNT